MDAPGGSVSVCEIGPLDKHGAQPGRAAIFRGMWWSPKSKRTREPVQGRVHVFFFEDEIVIGGRSLQPDQDPLDLMKQYFEEGPPGAKGS